MAGCTCDTFPLVLAGGLLPPDLQAAADAALERYRENDQQAPQALPVVVSD